MLRVYVTYFLQSDKVEFFDELISWGRKEVYISTPTVFTFFGRSLGVSRNRTNVSTDKDLFSDEFKWAT